MEATEIKAKIESGRSRFTVKAFASGILSSFGHDPAFSVRHLSGEIGFVPGEPERASLRLVIQPGSLEVTNDVNSKDRMEIERTMREEVLEVAKYPEIVFESSSVSGTKVFENQYRVSIEGKLTMHGVTRNETLEAQVTINGDQLRAYGDFSLRQTDYNIKLVSVAGGTMKIKDELKCSFDISARP